MVDRYIELPSLDLTPGKYGSRCLDIEGKIFSSLFKVLLIARPGLLHPKSGKGNAEVSYFVMVKVSSDGNNLIRCFLCVKLCGCPGVLQAIACLNL